MTMRPGCARSLKRRLNRVAVSLEVGEVWWSHCPRDGLLQKLHGKTMEKPMEWEHGDHSCWYSNFINHPPFITISMGGFPTIKHWWFMALLYPHYLPWWTAKYHQTVHVSSRSGCASCDPMSPLPRAGSMWRRSGKEPRSEAKHLDF